MRGLPLHIHRPRRLPRRPPHPALSPEGGEGFSAAGRAGAGLFPPPSPCRGRVGERGLPLHIHRPRQPNRRPPHPTLSPNGGEGFLCCREGGGRAASSSLPLQGEGRGEGSSPPRAPPVPAGPPAPSPYPLPQWGRGFLCCREGGCRAVSFSLPMQGKGWGGGVFLSTGAARAGRYAGPLTLPSPPKGARVSLLPGGRGQDCVLLPPPAGGGLGGLSFHGHCPCRLDRRPPHPTLSPKGGEGFPPLPPCLPEAGGAVASTDCRQEAEC